MVDDPGGYIALTYVRGTSTPFGMVSAEPAVCGRFLGMHLLHEGCLYPCLPASGHSLTLYRRLLFCTVKSVRWMRQRVVRIGAKALRHSLRSSYLNIPSALPPVLARPRQLKLAAGLESHSTGSNGIQDIDTTGCCRQNHVAVYILTSLVDQSSTVWGFEAKLKPSTGETGAETRYCSPTDILLPAALVVFQVMPKAETYTANHW